MQKNILITITIAIAVVVVAFSLIWRNKAAVPQASAFPSPSPTSQASPLLAVTPSPVPAEGQVKGFTVTARQFTFEPGTIRVKKGDTVRLTLINADIEHGIAIPAFGVNLKAPVGSQETTEFIADKTGAYDFFCSVFCGSGHREMKGQLIVE